MTERISILLPCTTQRREFLEEAVGSVLHQSSSDWELLVGLDPGAEPWMREWFARVEDPRVRLVPDTGAGFARTINQLMAAARTPLVSLLFSDDRYVPVAIETLLSYRERHPDADFFHSSCVHVDRLGRRAGPVRRSRNGFGPDSFKREGSPVKHLMCWRRDLALSLGGMDETISRHGCDDFDFPWRMAEAGARFQAVEECLYEYRVHVDAPRLTTATPLQEQVDIVERIFDKHGATRVETSRYLQRATADYLPMSFLGREGERDPAVMVRRWREAGPEAWPSFRRAGFALRHFFPHRIVVLPRGGPDGAKLAASMCDVRDRGSLREAVLFALPEAAPDLPTELFFDDEIVWHRQQLGLPGQVAFATMAVAGRELFVTQIVSDLFQRISRRRKLKTRVEGRFRGWAHLLLHGIMDYALGAGLDAVLVPTAALSMRHTDSRRTVQAPLFERIYDRTPRVRFHGERRGEWWRLETAPNVGRVAPLARGVALHQRPWTVCIVHDIERGLGHRDVDPVFAESADRLAPAYLRRMLDVEAGGNVRATYCVVGSLLESVRSAIEAGGHATAFHSYSHAAPRWGGWPERVRLRLTHPFTSRVTAAAHGTAYLELARCRQVDYRIAGYRPPRSVIGPGLDDRHLAHFNVEWLASSRFSLGHSVPAMENGIVKIPIHVDDFDLHRGVVEGDAWERRILDLADREEFLAIGLHDCFAEAWLDRYPSLLEKLGRRAVFRTLDEVADETALAHGLWC